MLSILMLTFFHWLKSGVYDGYVHTTIGNMNPPLCLWKSKIFITEIFILHVCITPSRTSPWFQSIYLIHATTDIILILPTPIKSRYGTEEIVYTDLQSVFHYGFQRKLKNPIYFKSIYVVCFLLHWCLSEQL